MARAGAGVDSQFVRGLDRVELCSIFGVQLRLIEYKTELDGAHQLIDIRAIEKYCVEHGF
jgi:hypothetical protein